MMNIHAFFRAWLSEMPYFFAVPVFVWQILFFYLPLFVIIGLSCSSYTSYAVFFDWVYVSIISRSLLLGLVTSILCLLVGYIVAYYLAFRAGALKPILLFLLISPFFTNFLLHVYAWYYVLDRGGFLNTLLLWIGVIKEPLVILNTPVAVYIMMVYHYLPFMVLPLYAALERFDRRLIEASLDLGASWFVTFYRVIVPLTVSGIQVGIFLVFVPACAEFAIPELLGGDRSMYAGTVISQLIVAAETRSLGAAFTIISSMCMVISALLLLHFLQKAIVRLGRLK